MTPGRIRYFTHDTFAPFQVPSPTEAQVEVWRQSGYEEVTREEYEVERYLRECEPSTDPAA